MKTLLALPLAALILSTDQASAACIYIQNTYSGVISANSEIIVQGPFTITGANGCSKANITSSIRALGAGSPPSLHLDKLTGSNWTQIDGGNKNNVSTLGEFGSYRIRLKNDHDVIKGYSGTTRYGR